MVHDPAISGVDKSMLQQYGRRSIRGLFVSDSEHGEYIPVIGSDIMLLIAESVISGYLFESQPEIMINQVVLVLVMRVILINIVVWQEIWELGEEPLQQILLSLVNILVSVASIVNVIFILMIWIVNFVGVLVLVVSLANDQSLRFLEIIKSLRQFKGARSLKQCCESNDRG